MKNLKKLIAVSFLTATLVPSFSAAVEPGHMPMMNGNYNQPANMMGNPRMMGNPDMDAQMALRNQMMQQQRMMQMMRQQNRQPQNMPDTTRQSDYANRPYGHMPMMMQQRHAMGQAHMAQMEKRLANIESLLQELVNLQKK